MKSVRIQVEYNDIKQDKHAANQCPIAKAFNRHGLQAFVNKHYIEIRSEYTRGWEKFTRWTIYHTPPLIGNWIEVYDKNEGVLPIDFEFNLDTYFLIKEC